jgi:uncharacterized membrane protein
MDFFILVAACIFFGVVQNRISTLRDDLDALKRRIKILEAAGRLEAAPEGKETPRAWEMPQEAIVKTSEPPPAVYQVPAAAEEQIKWPTYSIEKDEPKQKLDKPEAGFEQQFGARLPVWIGGIALALSGFYFVKYSIDAGWLSPTVRIVLGIIAGLGMLIAGNIIRNKPDFANGTRISQALSGAGLADLYVCIFAATNLYDLMPSIVGFAGMALVTAMAVFLSLRHGAPIALLGLIGGFLTPALIGSSHPSAPALFIYLYLVLTGLMIVIRKQGWWLLAMLTVAASFLWVVFWLLGSSFSPSDTLYLGLFLAAVSFTTVGFARRDQAMAEPLPDVTMACAFALMAFVASKGGFGYLEWSLFGLLTAGGIVMAFFDQAQYGKVPLFSVVINAVMLACWEFHDTQDFALILSLFAVLYAVSGYFLQSRSKDPLQWALLSTLSGVGYYLMGYFRLHDRITMDIPHFWGILAFALSALSIKVLTQTMRDVPEDHAQKQHLLAVFSAAATAFVSIGLCVEVDHAFLPVAIAGEVLALAWISARIDIQALRKITAIVAGVFAIVLFPQILFLLQIAIYSLVEARLDIQNDIPIVNWPIFQLGLPALFFLGSSIFLRRKKDGSLVKAFEVVAISLAGMMGYYFSRHLMHPNENILFVKPGFAERGVITNILFAYGLLCLWLGKRYARNAVSACGLVLNTMAVFRVGYFDLFIHNPLWVSQDVGKLPVINTLLLTYGAPIFWISQATRYLLQLQKEAFVKYGYASMLLLAFVLISFEVRQVFHGAFLNQGITTNAEIYSYSIAWLLFGLGLLFFGTLRRDKMIRIASLVIMILTVGKVFLYDASALTGLFRVFSFAGLGLSLLGLSWFYTRFVFQDRKGSAS